MTELKKNIETVAKEENMTALEVISLMQAGAAKIGDEKTLEALCELKWEYIEL